MCAVIGVYGKMSESVLFYIRRLFEESQIRGKHATGISFIEDGILHTVKFPIPAKEFVNTFNLSALPDELRVIGHCRYSTSDLRFNQPISSEDVSIVHNGVISQEAPEFWLKDFGYKCATGNDSELILRSIEAGDEPIDEFKDKSVAAIVLKPKDFYFFRNGFRPLWYTNFEGTYYIASTKDILLRTFGLSVLCIKCEAGIIYSIDQEGVFKSLPDQDWVDNQTKTDCSEYYGKVEL